MPQPVRFLGRKVLITAASRIFSDLVANLLSTLGDLIETLSHANAK